MSLRMLFVADPLESFLVERDTTLAIMLAAQARGHSIHEAQIHGLHSRLGIPHARAARVEVARRAAPGHFIRGAWTTERLDSFDVVFMRKDPPVDTAFTTALWLMDLVDRKRTWVMNDPRSILAANEKVYAMRFPRWTPETLVSARADEITAFYRDMGEDIILKPLDGHAGAGVLRVVKGDRNLHSMIELLTQDGRRWLMAQRYLPAARQGDKRIILVDGEPVGCMLRVPAEHDNRGNMHVGATVHAASITEREREMCADVGARLREDGLTFVGIDVIGELLTEVNVTSPTGAQDIVRMGGADAALKLVEVVERDVDARRQEAAG